MTSDITARLIINGGGHGRQEFTYSGEMGYFGLTGWLERRIKEFEEYPEVKKLLGGGKWKGKI